MKYTTITEKNIVNKNGVIVDKSFQYVLNNIVQNRNAYDILVIDTSSKGVLNSNKLLTLLINHSEMLDNIIQNMSMPSGYLKTEGRLTQNTINKMRESWKNIYSGPKNIARTVILEEGLSYHPLEMDLNKFQNNETKAAFIEDAQRLFGLFNVKSDSDYLKYCINPLISCIENTLTSQLLLTLEKEKNTKFIFNTEEVIKASEVERV
ncbi:phage portal protein [Clostridium sp. LQ25]|nr:phage portal protein [Clostridium sp. LQ25]